MTTLITGATGTVGGHTATQLLDAGAKGIRVGTRRKETAAAFAERGAEVVQLDLEQPSSLGDAFAGVKRLLLVGPMPKDFGAATAEVIDAAKAAGVEFVLRISALGADATSEQNHLAKQHGIAEEHLKKSGLGYTILQPTFFADNFINFQGDAIRGQSTIYGASGEGKASYIDSEDIGRVSARILSEPDAHDGKTYVLTGPAAHSDAEIAALLSDVLGRTVRYVDLPPEQLLAGMKQGGLPDWLAESLVALEDVKKQGWAADVSPAVEQITGKKPGPVRDYFVKNRAKLS